MTKSYKIEKAAPDFALTGKESWDNANLLKIDNFLPNSSAHHPAVQCRVLYNSKGLFLRYDVKDKFVKCVSTKYQDSVCLDSCVEFFCEPPAKKGYVNFEFSAAGNMLLYHVIDASKGPKGGFKDWHEVPEKAYTEVVRVSTLPKPPCDFGDKAVDWTLKVFIPFTVFQDEFGISAPKSGDVWRANFYKCADKTAGPHWATWNVVPVCNFHMPKYFGEIVFG